MTTSPPRWRSREEITGGGERFFWPHKFNKRPVLTGAHTSESHQLPPQSRAHRASGRACCIRARPPHTRAASSVPQSRAAQHRQRHAFENDKPDHLRSCSERGRPGVCGVEGPAPRLTNLASGSRRGAAARRRGTAAAARAHSTARLHLCPLPSSPHVRRRARNACCGGPQDARTRDRRGTLPRARRGGASTAGRKAGPPADGGRSCAKGTPPVQIADGVPCSVREPE